MRRVRVGPVGILVALACAGGVAYAAVQDPLGVIGPSNGIQPSGRHLHPEGRLTQLGNLPTGGALTPNGRFLWALSTGRGRNDVRIVQVAKARCGKKGKKGSKKCNRRAGKKVGTVVQTIAFPGLSGGIAMAPDGRTVYVSGLKDSTHPPEQVDPSVPGREGDVIHILHYDPKTGLASRAGTISVPPPNYAPPAQSFPPSSAVHSWPRDIAVSRDGRTLLVALNLADAAAVIDTATGSVRYVPVGHYPYGAGIRADGRYGMVTSETAGTVSVIDLAAAKAVKTIQVAPRLSHPEAIAVDPKAPLAFVANASQDTITVIDTNKMEVARTLSVERSQGLGSSPTNVNVTPDGCDLLSADSGEDAVAVFALSRAKRCGQGGKPAGKKKKHGGKGKGGKKSSLAVAEPAAKQKGKGKGKGKGKSHRRRARPFQLVGRIPTGSYPTAVAASPKRRQLVWVSARGLGVGPNPGGPNPSTGDDTYQNQYLPSIVTGASGVLNYPSDRKIRKLTPLGERQVIPADARTAPAGTPIQANGPIKHVFYIVRENRTYDQVLGDDPRGDGDPALTLFGNSITPNLHALAQRFPLLDHVYANSEASIDGHYWTAAGAVSDYVIKNWHQNYAGRNRPYDFGSYVVSAPPKGYIFQRMLREGVSFYNYGEGLAGLSPFADKDRTQAETDENSALADPSRTDVQIAGGCYDSDINIFETPAIGPKTGVVYDSTLPPGANSGDKSRFDCFQGHFESQLPNSVPTFNYISLPLDHTQGLEPGKRTPDADIANNDWGLGQIVDEISHSPIWGSSLILVVEDDSQNGADHVDAHRIPALAISPYTQQGAVVHNRFDQLSFLRTLEIVSGLQPQTLGENLAVPLYDAFTSSPGNSAPYNAITPSVNMTATNPNSAVNLAATRGLNLDGTDQVDQHTLDALLWHFVHGFKSKPPPAGPNASTQDGPGADEDTIDPKAIVRQIRNAARGKPVKAPVGADPDG